MPKAKLLLRTDQSLVQLHLQVLLGSGHRRRYRRRTALSALVQLPRGIDGLRLARVVVTRVERGMGPILCRTLLFEADE